jgi:O-methyltransferase involved in polyketide biosynthesis
MEIETNSANRDYSSISPSARSLLLLKGLTSIPFAREAAGLMVSPEIYKPDYENTEISFWARLLHFESRYQSIDQLLSDLPAKNILELSSGFSFRGLAATQERDVHYIDTDLDNVIELKEDFINALKQAGKLLKGKLEVLPLNALNKEAFIEITDHFDEEEIVIVNEGLLVYLDVEEKKELLKIIHDILEQHGGYWITADIYIKSEKLSTGLTMNDELSQFFKQHRIEENKFDSFEAAEEFFNNAGFVIDKVAVADYTKSTALSYLLKNSTPDQRDKMSTAGRIRATWRLKIKE